MRGRASAGSEQLGRRDWSTARPSSSSGPEARVMLTRHMEASSFATSCSCCCGLHPICCWGLMVLEEVVVEAAVAAVVLAATASTVPE